MDIKDIQVGKKYRYEINFPDDGYADSGTVLVETVNDILWPVAGPMTSDQRPSVNGDRGNFYAHELIEEV